MYLFLGYLDGATQFAQSCRGGGGDTSLPWDRNPAEDDRRRLPLHDASPQDAETISAETKYEWKKMKVISILMIGIFVAHLNILNDATVPSLYINRSI